MQLTITAQGLGKVQDLFRKLSGPQQKQVYARALNDVGFQVRRDMQQELRTVFSQPTRYITSSPRVFQATPDRLQVRIAPTNEDTRGGAPISGVDPQKILRAQADGGRRRDKRSEIALRSIGALPAGWQTAIPHDPMPGSTTRQGQQFSGRWLKRLVAQLQSGGVARRTPNAPRQRRTRGPRYFVVRDTHSGLHPGVWVAMPDRSVRPAVIFVRSPGYTPRLSMDRIDAKADRRAYFERRMRYRTRQEHGI